MGPPKIFTLAEKGIPKTAIVLPQNAGEVLRDAALDLQAVLERIIGIAPSLRPDDGQCAPQGSTTLHVGPTTYARSLDLNTEDAGVEGYRLVTFGRDLFILGGSDSGTSYGVYGLLEDHLRVRFFMPGELFTDIPVQTTLRLAHIDEIKRPDFLHREFSGISGIEGAQWERRNRVSHRRPELPYTGFHHALYSIFPVARYGTAYPEYYALIDGKRLIPASDAESNAHFGQPCTSNPDVVDITIQAARLYFDVNPEAHCFSLGMNDNVDFCQCDRCRALDVTGLIFRGLKVYSDRWFTYINAVARELQDSHPGKFVGCLAYVNVESPPKNIDRLEPNVTIYLTQDTAQHLDSQYRHQDREFIRSWIAKCDHVCKYDYYGLGWVLPRFFPHLLADDIKFQHRAGIKGFYAEAYPHWPGFGPQIWLASKLWWDSDQDVETLLDEFFTRLFQSAAVQVWAFYDRLETIWQRPRQGRWFQGLRGFHDQVPCFTINDVDDLEGILASAHKATLDSLVRLRIDYIRRWFIFPTTLIRGWHLADEILAVPPSPETCEKATELTRLKSLLKITYQKTILEDRLMPKTAYFNDGRYQTCVADPWHEKINQAVIHAQS